MLKENVERQMQCNFNFALVNLFPDGNSVILPHRDDERDLVQDMPIPTLNFGCTRTVIFTRKDVPKILIPLTHGSLYVMHPPTNHLFMHEICAKPEENKLPRISVTFRRIAIIASLLMKDRICDLTSDECERQSFPDMRYNLGSGLFIAVQLFTGEARVHIRQFKFNSPNKLFPSKEGVCFTPIMWHEFSSKIQSVLISNPETSFICGNALIGICANEELQLQSIISNGINCLKGTCVKLNSPQLNCLRENITLIHHSLTRCMYLQGLPNEIAELPLNEDHLELDEETFIFRLKSEIGEILKTKCKHNYLPISASKVYSQIDETILHCVNIKKFAADLVR